MADERTLRQRRRPGGHGGDLDPLNKPGDSSKEEESEAVYPDAITLFGTCCVYMSVAFIVLLSSVMCFALFRDSPIESLPFSLPTPPVLDGPLRQNSVLQNVKRVMEHQVYGPESFAVHSSFGTIYSGLRTGHIVEFRASGKDAFKIQRSLHLRYESADAKCTGFYSSLPECGRPLGLRFRRFYEDVLLIADAYYGLYEFNVVTADYKVLLKPGTPITDDPDAKPLQYLNDLDEMNDGQTIILSEPSTKFSDRDCLYAMAEHRGDGRLLSYNVISGKLKVLIDGLQYPNGVQVESSTNCITFAEMGNLRILRHCLNSSVPYTVVIENLPGYPDNIRLSRSGNLWVPLGSAKLEDDNWVTQRPWIRNLLAKMTTYGSFQWLLDHLSPKHGIVLLIDPKSGNVLKTLQDPTGSQISSISQVEELDDGTLLFGGDANAFVGVLSKQTEI